MENYNYLSYLYQYDDYYDFDKVNIDMGGLFEAQPPF